MGITKDNRSGSRRTGGRTGEGRVGGREGGTKEGVEDCREGLMKNREHCLDWGMERREAEEGRWGQGDGGTKEWRVVGNAGKGEKVRRREGGRECREREKGRRREGGRERGTGKWNKCEFEGAKG